jgi:hypothetical protein
MNTIGLINSFLTASVYVVTRRSSAQYVKGHAVAQPALTFKINGSVQPATSQDLMRLPEGRRTDQMKVLFTNTELSIGGQHENFEADLVNIDGDMWEVQAQDEWGHPNGPKYYRCMVKEVQV